MHIIVNDLIEISLDPQWPRIVSLLRKGSGGQLSGCDPALPFTIELDGVRHAPEPCAPETTETTAQYLLNVPDAGITMAFRFELDGDTVTLSLTNVEGDGEAAFEHWRIPDHRLVTGLAANGDSYLRHVTRRTNWSRHWCPGTGTYDQWEDFGPVGDGPAELGPQLSDHACVWNDRICAAFDSSIHVEPLVTELSPDGQVLPGRAGRFSISAGTHWYRLRGTLAKPFRVTIGLLGDWNGNGRIDWCDAAAWEGARVFPETPAYAEVLVYKLMTDNAHEPLKMTFDDCLDIIRRVHDVSGGLKQVVYVVGWQYTGHDTGYPSFDQVNERPGGREGLVRLMEEAGQYNCVVSVHSNVDDSYPENPGHAEALLSRAPGTDPYCWIHREAVNRQAGFSISHTLDVESGNFQDRVDALLDLLPIRQTIHFDAHRPYNEVWTEDGGYIPAECEVQRGMIPILEALRERGIDLTTEDSDAEKRGLYRWAWHWPNWLHSYAVVMCHGRVPGRWHQGLQSSDIPRPEGQALGLCVPCSESTKDSYEDITRKFYLNWMYAQIMARKKMTDYWIGDWAWGVRAEYEDDTRTEAGSYAPPRPVETLFEGIPIAKGTDRFLPWRADTLYAYSIEGGPQEWTLPEAWKGKAITSVRIEESGETPGPELVIIDRTIRFTAPAGIAIRLELGAEGLPR